MKFYIRYVEDTLLLPKEVDIVFIFNKFNSFHKNVKFTIDRFNDNNIHFSTETKLTYTTNTLILVNILTLTVMLHGIIKFHRLNPFTTKQTKFVHQSKSLGFKLTR